MTTYYVTKWVIRRGILVFKGKPPERRERDFKDHVWLDLGEQPWRNNRMTIGTDAFLTLAEAQQDAEYRFQAHLEKCRQELERAEKAWKQLAEGKLQAHRQPNLIRKCHPFERCK
jgi:hypothetical protein